jgi:hypothetical protein
MRKKTVGENKNKKRPQGARTESRRLTKTREGSRRRGDDESRETFVVRGSTVETPEGFKLRF